MNKQGTSRFPTGNTRKTTQMDDRYYVQCLTEQVFLVRERTHADKEAGTNDRIVHSFNMRYDAYTYVDQMNEKQKKLDEEFGSWTQSAT